MTHEPECPESRNLVNINVDCPCDELRAAYQRGRDDAAKEVNRRYATEFTWDELLSFIRGDGERT